MDISIKFGSKIEKDLELMLQFAEKIGIVVDKEIIDYSLNPHFLSFTTAKYGIDENILECVVIQLDVVKNKVTVKRSIRNEFDFQLVGNNPMTSYRRYTATGYQAIVEFKVNSQKREMEVTTASVIQTIKEDERGGGNWFISLYDTLADFQDDEKKKFLPDKNCIEMEKRFVEVPDGYKITDGLEPIEDKEFIKVKHI